jgi:DNA-binding NarL/FixJ family response regulator
LHLCKKTFQMFILLVDNNRFHATVVKEMLLKAGFDTVGYAENGIECAIKVYDEKPEVIIIDESQCNINGVDIIKNIQMTRPGIRIIVMAENDGLQNTPLAAANNPVLYIPKPDISSENLPQILYGIFTEKLSAKKVSVQQAFTLFRKPFTGIASS